MILINEETNKETIYLLLCNTIKNIENINLSKSPLLLAELDEKKVEVITLRAELADNRVLSKGTYNCSYFI